MTPSTSPIASEDSRGAVRFATAEDLAQCLAFNPSVHREILRRKIECDEILVAETRGEIVGYLRLEHLWSKMPFIGLIHVQEEHRAAGVGRALLEFLESFLREGGHRVLLSSSMADAAKAQAWHRKRGFEECGFLAGVNAGGIGEVFFRKPLA